MRLQSSVPPGPSQRRLNCHGPQVGGSRDGGRGQHRAQRPRTGQLRCFEYSADVGATLLGGHDAILIGIGTATGPRGRVALIRDAGRLDGE